VGLLVRLDLHAAGVAVGPGHRGRRARRVLDAVEGLARDRVVAAWVLRGGAEDVVAGLGDLHRADPRAFGGSHVAARHELVLEPRAPVRATVAVLLHGRDPLALEE